MITRAMLTPGARFTFKDGGRMFPLTVESLNDKELIFNLPQPNFSKPILRTPYKQFFDLSNNDKRYKISKISSLKKQILDRRAQIESLNEHILGFRKDTSKWNQVRSQILRKESENERDIEMLENLENDQEIEIEDHLPPLDCDEKLVVAADDIKEMKKDSSKFSKTISELVT